MPPEKGSQGFKEAYVLQLLLCFAAPGAPAGLFFRISSLLLVLPGLQEPDFLFTLPLRFDSQGFRGLLLPRLLTYLSCRAVGIGRFGAQIAWPRMVDEGVQSEQRGRREEGKEKEEGGVEVLGVVLEIVGLVLEGPGDDPGASGGWSWMSWGWSWTA